MINISTLLTNIKVYIYIGLFLGVISFLVYAYYKYNNMISTIENQEIIIKNKDIELSIEKANYKELERKHSNEILKLKAETKIKAKQKEIEKGVSYDKSNSREITSTYIDLP